MVVYTPSQRLPRFNSVPAFSSWFWSICAFRICRVPRATSVPTLCLEYFLFFFFSVHVVRPFYFCNYVQRSTKLLLGRSVFFHGIFCFSVPCPPSYLCRDAVGEAFPKIVFFVPQPHPLYILRSPPVELLIVQYGTFVAFLSSVLGVLFCSPFPRPSLFFFDVIYVPLYAFGFFRCIGPYGRYSRAYWGVSSSFCLHEHEHDPHF